MLRELIIKNYAIIDNIHLKLQDGLNIVTGETGAGKSIIMGALGLTLGNRVDNTVLKNNEGKCVVEAVFVSENKEIISFFKERDLDYDNTIIIRREINASGKSRSFINDTPVTLSELKQLSSFLIDQHQQFDNLLIGNTNFQQKVIDSLAENGNLLIDFQKVFHLWKASNEKLTKLIKQKQAFNNEADFLQFQYKELEELNLQENELENLEEELKLIESAGDVKSVLNKIYFSLYEDENSLINSLKSLANDAKHFFITKELESLSERLKSAEIELKDIAQEADQINERLSFDAEKLDVINDRLSAGYKLFKKHNRTSTNELILLKENFASKLKTVFNIDSEIENAEKESKELENQAFSLAEKISEKRINQIKKIESNVNSLLAKVGMPNAKIKVNILRNKSLTINGIDEIDFLFDANKTGIFESVEKVASGGELSRLMLCIKSLVAKSVALPTLIFDEIDTGISGEAAKQVGLIMQELSQYLQVIAITHQPQIASMANAHYFVYKLENEKNEINTQIRLLTQEERIQQIAQMLSGNNPSETALNTAKEMLQNVL